MEQSASPFRFACAPNSWGVLDYPSPSWEQSYEQMLDDMVAAGYSGTELGPFGFFPTEPSILRPQFEKRSLKLLASFVPVVLSDPASAQTAVDRIREVGHLLSALGAPFLVLSDAQSDERTRVAGRVPRDGSAGLTAAQWKNVAGVVEQAVDVAKGFGLDLVFHPHVATHVETPEECERFFDVTSHTGVGLCLDTGHCLYSGGDCVKEASKFASILRFVHIKDLNRTILEDVRHKKLTFEEGIAADVFTTVGEGSVDFPAFFRELLRLNYHGWMVIEQDVTFGATSVSPAESVAKGLRYLQELVRDLVSSPVR